MLSAQEMVTFGEAVGGGGTREWFEESFNYIHDISLFKKNINHKYDKHVNIWRSWIVGTWMIIIIFYTFLIVFS